MTMDRADFFAAVRKSPFNGRLSVKQVEGMEAILNAAPADVASAELAYVLATAFLETDRTMQPIKEYGGYHYFMRMYDKTGDRPHVAEDLGNTEIGDGALFAGRGYVQLTGRRNYEHAGDKLGVDLVGNPDYAMIPETAAAILWTGMIEGWFTGKKLSDYFTVGRSDFVNARRIINGTDRAPLIAAYAHAFIAAIEAGTNLAPVLRKGASGPDVVFLQERLVSHGHQVSTDGDFGPQTEAAVRNFQRLNDLTADGVVGTYTWRALL